MYPVLASSICRTTLSHREFRKLPDEELARAILFQKTRDGINRGPSRSI
jgi:hypothetical protein